jgi:hypothetical protein
MNDNRMSVSNKSDLEEPERLPLCEICGSDFLVKDVAAPDTGHLLLCRACRILFAFGPDNGGKHGI